MRSESFSRFPNKACLLCEFAKSYKLVSELRVLQSDFTVSFKVMAIGSFEGNDGARLDPIEAVVSPPFSLLQVQTKVHFRILFLSLKERPVGPGCGTDFLLILNVLFNRNITEDPTEKLPDVQT